MYHKEWDHNAMVDGVFEEFAKEIDAKVEERASKKVNERERQMAKAMRDYGDSIDKIAAISGLSVEEISNL